VFLLTAPWLAGKHFLPPREQAYASLDWKWGPYPWIEKQIYNETNSIDIAFIGSSRIDWAIDTPYVQEKLDERLTRKSVVRSMCWAGGGFDALFFIAKDLLEHRHVRTLVFCDESDKTYPAVRAVNWYRFGDNATMISGLQFKYKAYYYFAAAVGMPRNLVEMLTPNLPEGTDAIAEYAFDISPFHRAWHAANPESRLGAVIAQTGFRNQDGGDEFFPFLPQTDVKPSDVCTYTPTTATNFAFADRPLPAWQIFFLRQFALEAKNHDCKLVLLHIPRMSEKESFKITESAYWPRVLQTDVSMMGIPTGRLCAGLSELEIKRLFSSDEHFNQNGLKYFTPLIVPGRRLELRDFWAFSGRRRHCQPLLHHRPQKMAGARRL
jgi:hypothetical protein